MEYHARAQSWIMRLRSVRMELCNCADAHNVSTLLARLKSMACSTDVMCFSRADSMLNYVEQRHQGLAG